MNEEAKDWSVEDLENEFIGDLGLELNTDLIWSSDWAGDEVGYPQFEIVGLYDLKDTTISMYIDTEDGFIIEAWESPED